MTDSKRPEYDLNICEKEPIHIPGAIQPLAGLIAFSLDTGLVLHYSANITDFFPETDLSVENLMLSSVIGEDVADELSRIAGQGRISDEPLHKLVRFPAAHKGKSLNGVFHFIGATGYLEVEHDITESWCDWFDDFNDLLEMAMVPASQEQLLQRVVNSIKQITGFDRVMIYRFHQNWDGQVLAEAKEPDQESFFDLHYPASDIPAQARQLYLSNLVRYIGDVHYTPVPVSVVESGAKAEALDMSHCLSRSVSPVHLQYLKNMGTGSTITISLLRDNRLWGLVSCHHREPTIRDFRLQVAFQALSKTLSMLLTSNDQKLDLERQVHDLALQKNILEKFNQPSRQFEILVKESEYELLSLARANGGVFWSGDDLFPFGQSLTKPRTEQIFQWTREQLEKDRQTVFFSDAITLADPLSEEELKLAAGVAAVSFPTPAEAGILWYRPEYRREVKWGGDPNKPVEIEFDENGQMILTPRNSFAQWLVIARGKCREWSEGDRAAISSLMTLKEVLMVRESMTQFREARSGFKSLDFLHNEIYWRIDADSLLISMSHSMLPDIDKSMGKPILDVFAGIFSAHDLKRLVQALDKQTGFDGLELHGQENTAWSHLHFKMQGAPLFKSNGRPDGMHGKLTDMSHLHESNPDFGAFDRTSTADLVRDLEEAKKHSEAKSLFLANMSHEIRNPMHAIIGMTYLALQTPLEDKQLKYITSANKAAHHLMGIINNILDLSKIESGQMELDNTSFELEEIVTDTINMLKASVLEKKLRLDVELSDDIPETLFGDPMRLSQILLNLLGNAIKFSDKRGKIRLKIDVDELNGANVVLHACVVDTGPGMSEEVQQKLFANYVQANAAISSHFGGTGLGLAISKHLTEMMGGRIWVESQLDIGSKFHFTVQLQKVSGSQDEKAAVVSDHVIRAMKQVDGASILLVEDDELNQELAVDLLATAGVSVAIAKDGVDALTYLQTHDVDLVLMDCEMPRMDGYEATRRIRDVLKKPDLPIIAMTASAFKKDVENVLRAGMNDFLGKPFEPEQLFRILAKWL